MACSGFFAPYFIATLAGTAKDPFTRIAALPQQRDHHIHYKKIRLKYTTLHKERVAHARPSILLPSKTLLYISIVKSSLAII